MNRIGFLVVFLASGLVAGLPLQASAGAAPPSWARPPKLSGAATPWRTTIGPARLVAKPAPAAQQVWNVQKIIDDDWVSGDLFGYESALTSNTVFVAAPGVTIDGNLDEGAVYVYTKVNGAWTQAQKLTASDGGAGDEFGDKVRVSGNTLLVGAPGHEDSGAVYVFEYYDGTWNLDQELMADETGGGFGVSVVISDATAIIGAPGVNNFAGAAYVFKRVNGIWMQSQELLASDGAAGDGFGWSVGISGTTALVSAPYATVGGNAQQGAAYMFTRAGGSWTQAQKLTASDGAAGDLFGDCSCSTALYGTTAIIVAPHATVGGVFTDGAAYVFNQSGGTWSQTQKLTGNPDLAPNELFSVALNGDTAVIGAPVATINGNFLQGAAYVFTKSDGVWTLENLLTASDGTAGELFGLNVGLSGNSVLATTLPDAGGGPGPGAVYIYGPINLGVASPP